MPLEYEVTVLRIDPHGRLCWRSTLAVNDALLTLLRFARKHPESHCRIELRDCKAYTQTVNLEIKQAAHAEGAGLQEDRPIHAA